MGVGWQGGDWWVVEGFRRSSLDLRPEAQGPRGTGRTSFRG